MKAYKLVPLAWHDPDGATELERKPLACGMGCGRELKLGYPFATSLGVNAEGNLSRQVICVYCDDGTGEPAEEDEVMDKFLAYAQEGKYNLIVAFSDCDEHDEHQSIVFIGDNVEPSDIPPALHQAAEEYKRISEEDEDEQ